MARTKKTEPKAETTTAEETQKEAPVTPETTTPSDTEGASVEKRLEALGRLVVKLEKRIAELERVTAYRKPVTSADILGL